MQNIKSFQELWANFSQNLNANLFYIWCYPYARGMYNEFIYFNEIYKSKKRISNYTQMEKEDLFFIQYLIEKYRNSPDDKKKLVYYIQTNNNIGSFLVTIFKGMYIHKRVRRVKVDQPVNLLRINNDEEELREEEIYFLSPNLSSAKDWLDYWINDLNKSERGADERDKHFIQKVKRDLSNFL